MHHLLNNSRRNPLTGNRLQIILPHLPIPPMRHKIRSKLLILNRQIRPGNIRNKKPRHQHTHHPTNSSDNECPSFPQVVLNGREDFRSDGCACFSESGRDAVAGAADGGGVGFGGEEAEHVTGAEVAGGEHEAIEYYEERDYFCDFVVGAADDEAEDHYQIC